MTDDRLFVLAQGLGAALCSRKWMLATAESCTGGWVAQEITAVAGSSQWFERGFVTYSNAAKYEMLSVDLRTLEQHGAVSEQTAIEMASGALAHSRADVALAVSGIAGPDGGTPQKPVGTVCLAWAVKGRNPVSETQRFDGGREAIRRQAVARALRVALDLIAAA
ncbi:MAG: CinA family protein [Burkholderiales bacterium]|nr:nicotinamide-nucleotide amidohydrolase family protein [Pseudomonadota bacterium]